MNYRNSLLILCGLFCISSACAMSEESQKFRNTFGLMIGDTWFTRYIIKSPATPRVFFIEQTNFETQPTTVRTGTGEELYGDDFALCSPQTVDSHNCQRPREFGDITAAIEAHRQLKRALGEVQETTWPAGLTSLPWYKATQSLEESNGTELVLAGIKLYKEELIAIIKALPSCIKNEVRSLFLYHSGLLELPQEVAEFTHLQHAYLDPVTKVPVELEGRFNVHREPTPYVSPLAFPS